ncbi:MAG TPA: DnaD domain protein [Clostridiaceae bacterium]|nr:DnaD domain protein [Clostridiaceae bacterium]
MQVSFNSTLHLSDTLVPDLFITEYINKLSGNAIRCYLTLLLTFQHGNRKASPADIAQRLGVSVNKAEQALTELQQVQLIVIQSGIIELVDLKAKEIKRSLLRSPPDENVSETDLSRREAIVQQINDTFFQGVMSLGFYTVIDEWFSQYQFEPEVVYAIFAEASSKQMLKNPGYVSGIAQNWGKSGVKTYSQLNQYYKKFEERQILIQKIRKKLKIKGFLTEYQEEFVDRWTKEYGYNFEIIDLAMAQTVNVGSPSFKYIDTILTAWHKKGLKTAEAIEADQKAHREQSISARKVTSSPKTRRRLKTREQAEQDIPEEELYRLDLIQRYSEAGEDKE